MDEQESLFFFFNIAVLYHHYHESCLMGRQCVCLFLFKQWQWDRSVTQAVSLALRFKEFVERAFLCSDLQHWIKHGVHKRNQVLPSHIPSVGKIRKDRKQALFAFEICMHYLVILWENILMTHHACSTISNEMLCVMRIVFSLIPPASDWLVAFLRIL